jgi:hypothetical protein
VALTLLLGQDIGLVVLAGLAAARVFKDGSAGREVLAGLVASVVAIKITYLPAVGLVFLARSRRGSVGLAVGLAIQVAVSFAFEGVGWPSEYQALLRKSLQVFNVHDMPNFRAVVMAMSLPGALYLVGAIPILGWLWVACRRLRLPEALVLALALGMIASPYGFVYDAVVTIPLAVSVASVESWDGLLAGAVLTPIPWLLLMTPNPLAPPLGSALAVASTLAGAWRLLQLRPEETREGAAMRVEASPSFC